MALVFEGVERGLVWNGTGEYDNFSVRAGRTRRTGYVYHIYYDGKYVAQQKNKSLVERDMINYKKKHGI